MKALVVYYSRTGTTAHIAEEIAAGLGADLEALGDRARRAGVLGWLRCGYEGYAGAIVPLAPLEHDLADYDVVVIGGPIWSGAMSSPVRSFLREHRRKLPAVAFFSTCGGRGDPRLSDRMTAECGITPIATLTVRGSERGRAPADIARFVTEIRGAAPVHRTTSTELRA